MYELKKSVKMMFYDIFCCSFHGFESGLLQSVLWINRFVVIDDDVRKTMTKYMMMMVDEFGDDFLFPVYRLFNGLTYSKYYTLVR